MLMPHEKLLRIINLIWLVTLFPIAAACTAGSLGHSLVLGIKTFLLIEFGMAVLSPLLGAVMGDSGRSNRRKKR
jgi:hypothetical protein